MVQLDNVRAAPIEPVWRPFQRFFAVQAGAASRSSSPRWSRSPGQTPPGPTATPRFGRLRSASGSGTSGSPSPWSSGSTPSRSCASLPKHGSWLNMAEIEPSAPERRCRDRRLPDRATLTAEVAAWAPARNAAGTAVDWRFTTADARITLTRPYPALHARRTTRPLPCGRETQRRHGAGRLGDRPHRPAGRNGGGHADRIGSITTGRAARQRSELHTTSDLERGGAQTGRSPALPTCGRSARPVPAPRSPPTASAAGRG
jgi:hypothetical protein